MRSSNLLKKLTLAILCIFIASTFFSQRPATVDAKEEPIKPLSMERIHPLHKECLEALYSIVNDSSEIGINNINDAIKAYNEELQKFKPTTKEPKKNGPTIKDLLNKLDQINSCINKFIKTNKIIDDNTTISALDDKYKSLLNIINQLEGNDVRNPFQNNQFIRNEKDYKDYRDIKLKLPGNIRMLEKTKLLLANSTKVYVSLKSIQESVNAKISSIKSIDKSGKTTAIAKDSEIVTDSDKKLLEINSNKLDNYYLKPADFQALVNSINSFFWTYYANTLDYNNIRFPYYSNDFCNIVNDSGTTQTTENIQIQCVVSPPSDTEKDALYDKLMVNDAFLDSKGGGHFPGEYIRLGSGDALSSIYSITFYTKKDGSYKNVLFSCSTNYPANKYSYTIKNDKNGQGFTFDGSVFINDMHKFNTSKYSSKQPNYMLLSRKAILSIYPNPPEPLRVMVEIRALSGTEIVKYQKEITLLPAYNQGLEVSGESSMFIRSKRLSENKRPLSEEDFLSLGTTAGTPRKGGFIAQISKDRTIEYAAYILDDSDKQLTLLHPDGVTVSKISKSKPVLKNSQRVKNKDGTVTNYPFTIKFNCSAYEAKADLCTMLLKDVKTYPLSALPYENTGNDDDDVYEDIFERGLKLSDGSTISFDTLPDHSDFINCENIPGLINYNIYNNYSVYAHAYNNIITKFTNDYCGKDNMEKSTVSSFSELPDDIKYNYLLFNIYDQYALLPTTEGDDAHYTTAYNKLKESKFGNFISSCIQNEASGEKPIRSILSAGFPTEIKKLKMQGSDQNMNEANYRLPNIGDLVAFDIPNEIIFDDSGIDSSYTPYIMSFDKKPTKSVALYKGFKVENKNTWHYFLSSGYLFEEFDELVSAKEHKDVIKQELELIGIGEDSLREYRISDKLFWLLISSSVKTDISQALYKKIAVSPMNEFGYLRYNDFPYYYYTENSTGEVLPDPSWKATKSDTPIKIGATTVEVNKEAEDLFSTAFSSLVANDKYLSNVSKPNTYSFKHINGKPENPLENHAFGIALDINTKLKPTDDTKNNFFNNIFGKYSRTAMWKYYTDSFEPSGFAFGGYLGTYGPKQIENGHFEINSFKTYSPKYIQKGLNILNSDISTYKLNIPSQPSEPGESEKDCAVIINLFNAPGDYDIMLFDIKNRLISYSMNGTPKLTETAKGSTENHPETIIKGLSPGTYTLKIYGYAQKFKPDKYAVEIKFVDKASYHKTFTKPAIEDSNKGIFKLIDIIDEDKAIMDIIKDYKNNAARHIVGYAASVISGNNDLWLWPLPFHDIDFNKDYKTLIKEGTVTSGWPKRNDGIGLHGGIDLPGCDRGSGVLVRAVESGWASVNDSMVTCSDEKCKQLNNQYSVSINHGGKYLTTYIHFIRNGVLIKDGGEYVNKGDVIGFMGTTGNSTGVHLHHAVYNEKWGNPTSCGIDPLNNVNVNTWRNNVLENLFKRYSTEHPEKYRKNIMNMSSEEQLWYDYYTKEASRPDFKGTLKDITWEHPNYYPISKDVPTASYTLTDEGIDLICSGNNLAVTALIIAENPEIYKSYKHDHSSYIASVLEFRKKIEIPNTIVANNKLIKIKWPETKLPDPSSKNKKYYLRIEVEDLNSGRSWVNRTTSTDTRDVTDYVIE